MNCIIVDDEPLARSGMELLISQISGLHLIGSFNHPVLAANSLTSQPVDLIFLDIQMPGINGIDFAKSLPDKTLIIFTTAYSEYALDSYQVDAIDYLVKPISSEKFHKSVQKAFHYRQLLELADRQNQIESVTADYMFVKADRKFYKVLFKELLFIEGLKDYVVLHLPGQRLITAMNIKTIQDRLPTHLFIRVSKSYLVNAGHITTFDNNTIYLQGQEIPIGDNYRAHFFDHFVKKNLLSR